MSPCVWEAREPTERRNNLAEATAIWKSDAALDIPDLQSFMVEAPYASPQAAMVAPPPNSWSLTTAVLRTASRVGCVSPDPTRAPRSPSMQMSSTIRPTCRHSRSVLNFAEPSGTRRPCAASRSAKFCRVRSKAQNWRHSFAMPRSAIPTRPAQPRWGAMPCQSWTTVSGFTASIGCGSRTDRSCRASLPVIPWRPALSSASAGEMLKADHNL